MERACASPKPSLIFVKVASNYVVASGENTYKLIGKGTIGVTSLSILRLESEEVVKMFCDRIEDEEACGPAQY